MDRSATATPTPRSRMHRGNCQTLHWKRHFIIEYKLHLKSAFLCFLKILDTFYRTFLVSVIFQIEIHKSRLQVRYLLVCTTRIGTYYVNKWYRKEDNILVFIVLKHNTACLPSIFTISFLWVRTVLYCSVANGCMWLYLQVFNDSNCASTYLIPIFFVD